jgi:acetylornithine deacetylase
MDAKPLIDRLRAAVEANFAAQTAFLAEIVRHPSLRGQEAALQAHLAGEMEARGWQVDSFSLAEVDLAAHPKASPMVDVDPAGSIQVVGSYTPAQTLGRSLILQGHIDVVPEGPAAMWTHPPYAAHIQDGWMYGRGAHDMKSGVAAMFFAMDALTAAGLRPTAPIHIQTVTEEESTGNGALATLLRGYRADAALIPEPTGGTITRAHTGTLWFRLRVAGVPVHVAVAQTGSNAIMSAYQLIQALYAHTAQANKAAAGHPWYAGIDSPIKFNPGIIRGGDWASSTPAWCEVDCRIGLLPGQEVATVQKAVEDAVAAAARADGFMANNPPELTWHGFLADGYVLEPGTEAEAVLARAHQAAFGEDMPARITTAVNDTRFYGLYFGIPGLCYGPKGEGAHAFDERTHLEHLKTTTLAMALFIAEWCGVEEA